MKPRESGGNVPKAKVKVKVVVPPREVAVGRPAKPQKMVKSKKGSFPAPHPEVSRPITAKQRKAAEKSQPLHFTDKRANQKTKKFRYNGGDPLTSLNSVFNIAGAVTQAGLGKIHAPKIVRNAGKEILDSPTQTIPALAATIAHPKTVVDQIKYTVKHPKQAFENAPISTLLLLRGGEAALSRGAGAALRAAPKGSALHDIASTERAPLKTVGGDHQQHYSKGLVEKQLQKAGEKSKTVQEIKAKRVTNRAIDRNIGINEGVRRIERDRGRVPVANAQPKHGADVVSLVNEGVIKHPKTIQRDLHAELDRLNAERPTLTEPHDVKLNKQSIKSVEGALADKNLIANPAPVFSAARTYALTQKVFTPKRVHYGDLEAKQAARRPLLPHAVREMGLHWDAEAKAFRTAEGATVSDRAILRDFKAKGGDPKNLAYVPETSKFKGAGNHYLATTRRPSAGTKAFKGINTKGGLYERDFNVLSEQSAKSAGRVSAHEGVDRLINTYGVQKPGGGLFNWNDAQKEILNQQAATGHDWVPLQVIRGQKGEAAARIKEGLNPSELSDMFRAPRAGDGNLVLFPKVVAERIRLHENIGTKVPLVKALQSVNQRFRHTVLPTSPRWMVGNIVEMVGRMAIEDPTLLKSIYSGKHVEDAVRAMGGEKAVDRLRTAAGAGHIGAQSKFDIYRAPETKIVQTLHDMRTKPGPKQVADAWDLYKRSVFGANTRAENLIYYSGLGKEAAREVQEATGAWHKTLNLGDAAYQDVARGLTNTANVERYARAIDDMRGRYSNLSPMARSLTLTFTPFLPWYGNALYFVFWTLPAHHPIKMALLGQTVESQRKNLEKLGMSHLGDNRLPAFLLGRVPTKKGLLPASQYTPFGATTDIGGNAADLFAPQLSFLKNLNGQNFAGNTLKDQNGREIPAGDPRTALVALNTIAESFTPFLRHARQVREKGGSPADTSTILSPKTKKSSPPVSYAEGAKRAFNPFYVAGRNKKPVGRTGAPDPMFHNSGKSKSDPLFR